MIKTLAGFCFPLGCHSAPLHISYDMIWYDMIWYDMISYVLTPYFSSCSCSCSLSPPRWPGQSSTPPSWSWDHFSCWPQRQCSSGGSLSCISCFFYFSWSFIPPGPSSPTSTYSLLLLLPPSYFPQVPVFHLQSDRKPQHSSYGSLQASLQVRKAQILIWFSCQFQECEWTEWGLQLHQWGYVGHHEKRSGQGVGLGAIAAPTSEVKKQELHPFWQETFRALSSFIVVLPKFCLDMFLFQ